MRRHGGKTENALRATIVCAAILVASAARIASADWQAFIPRPVANHAFVESFSSYERDNSSGSNDSSWSDLFFRERLTLQSRGYSYHPRFMQYQLSLSGLATHEYFEQFSDNTGWNNGGGFEYDTTLWFLPEHSYNLIFFASRYEPAFKEQAASSHDTVADTYGATARYRRKPFFFNSTYVDTSINSDISSSQTQQLSLTGEFFKEFKNGNEFSLNAAYNPSWTTGSQGFKGDAQEVLLNNYIAIKRVSLESSVSQNSFNQEQLDQAKYDTEQRNWYERLTVRWPYSFRSDLSYRLYDNKSKVDNPDDEPNRNYSEDGQRTQFDLYHQLYRSLDTTYTLLHDKRNSSGGDITFFSNFLNSNYTKNLPRESRFSTGVTYGRSETDNKGFADIVDEPYAKVPVPGTITLRQQSINPDTIQVLMRSPLPPFGLVQLTENENYRVMVVSGSSVEIEIFSLPSEFVVPGTYDFFVSYSLTSGTYKLQTDSFGTSVSLGLFGELLSPYFSYYGVRSDVLSGTFPGEPVDSDSYTTGFLVRHGPWRGRGEYQKLDWQVNPYWSWRSEIQYVGSITPSVNLYSTTWYLRRHYEGSNQGDDAGALQPYDEDTVTTSGSLQKQIFLRNLYLSVGGSYSHIWGQVDTQAWSANSSLLWKIGKLEISLGLTAYGSDSTGTGVYTTSRDHELIFLNLKRDLL